MIWNVACHSRPPPHAHPSSSFASLPIAAQSMTPRPVHSEPPRSTGSQSCAVKRKRRLSSSSSNDSRPSEADSLGFCHPSSSFKPAPSVSTASLDVSVSYVNLDMDGNVDVKPATDRSVHVAYTHDSDDDDDIIILPTGTDSERKCKCLTVCFE